MRHRIRVHRIATWAAVGALAVVTVACGSDKKTSTSAGSATSAAAPATTSPGGAPSTAAAGSDQSFEALLARPTKITNDTPITAEIPKGKNIMWIQCSVPACVALGEPLKAATDALGWNLKIVSHDGTPEGVKAAYEQAIREKPDGVVSSGYPRTIFEPELEQLAAAKIPVIEVTVTDPPGNGITAVINGPRRNAEVGRQLAKYVTGDSGGKAHALWVTAPFPIMIPELEGVDGQGGFGPTLAEICPDCTFDKLEVPIEALGTEAPARIVAHLQANPNVDYLIGAFGDIIAGLPGALADAGLAGKLKIATYSQNETLTSYLKEDSIRAVVGFPGPENMWQVVDTFARVFTDTPYETDQWNLPSWITTKDTVPASPAFYPLVEDYQAQYKALWGVS